MADSKVVEALTLAAEHQRSGRLMEAEVICRQILLHHPKSVNAVCRLAAIARQKQQDDLAVDVLRRFIAIAPRAASAHLSLGHSLQNLKRPDEAIAAYQQCIALDPKNAEAFRRLGNALGEKRRYGQALIAYRQAVTLRPESHKAWIDLGHLLRFLGRIEEAVAVGRKSVEVKSDSPLSHYLLGTALAELRQPDDAIAAFREAIRLNPEMARAYCDLGNVLKATGQIDDSIEACRQAVQLDPGNERFHSVLLFNLQYHPDYDAHAIAKEQRAWNTQHALPLTRFGHTSVPRDHVLHRRLRIGYVSPYFESHALGWNILPFYRHHDRSRFEIFSYSDVTRPDAMTGEFQKLSDCWRDMSSLTDDQLAEYIRMDRIDILVDLSQHMAGNRLLLFARKPAPIQVSFAGYPASTGLTAIDFRLSDPHLDPAGMDESVYSEATVRLPHSFWCYDPLQWADIAVSPLPAQRDGLITFGSLNNFCKVNDRVLGLWARVLRQVEGSQLVMLALPGSHRDRTIGYLAREGIDPGRIRFLGRMPRRQYLEAYHQIDIGLDTFPYNGHTTSLDAFWMGVPVVTLVGGTSVARAGLCQLSNIGLAELAGHDPAEFVRIAVDLARDLPRLEHLRSTLRSRMEQSPLMDAAGFTRGIEDAYWKMWTAG